MRQALAAEGRWPCADFEKPDRRSEEELAALFGAGVARPSASAAHGRLGQSGATRCERRLAANQARAFLPRRARAPSPFRPITLRHCGRGDEGGEQFSTL